MKRLADLSHAAMCLLVALYGAMVVLLMRQSTLPIPAFLLLTLGFWGACLLLSRRTALLGVDLPAEPDAWDLRVFLCSFGFSLAVLLVYLFAFFPGGFSSDTAYQWRQITGESALSDWHPALHTLAIMLLTRIIDHPAFVTLMQMICYALSVGYLVAVLWRWRMPRALCVLVGLYLGANPGLSNLLCFPWKDCAFAICALVLAAQMFSLNASRGEWLHGPRNLFALGVTLCLCAILRHNGIALSLAAVVWLFISFPQFFRRTLCALLIALALFGGIKLPLYSAFGVEKANTRIDELIGLPLTILSHVYVEKPESLDADIIAFLEDVAPREIYTEHHSTGDWNETKWFMGYIYTDRPYSVPEIFSFALRAMIAEPTLGFEALGLLWQMPMWPVSDAYWRISPYVDPIGVHYGVEAHPSAFLSRALNWLCRLTSAPLLAFLCWLPGFWLLMVMVFCVLFARKRPLSALLMPAMLIAYHLATCVMLSSSTDYRFFLSTMMIAPVALLALLARPSDRKETP